MLGRIVVLNGALLALSVQAGDGKYDYKQNGADWDEKLNIDYADCV